MTIKEFASLCGCNPQTIRYYDKINLLKPVHVDEWTGYRHYNEGQALDYVRIKNLQEADFSIEEIKALLTKSNDDICLAIEKKIEMEKAKLEHIKKIHATYLSQIDIMETNVREYISNLSSQFNMEEEFGITKEYSEHVLKCAADYFEMAVKTLNNDMADFSDYKVNDITEEADEEEEFCDLLNPDDYSVVFERHGWDKTGEVIAELPQMEVGEYILRFEIEEAKIINIAYTTIVLGIVVDQNKSREFSLSCNASITNDGINHFWLLKKSSDYGS